MANWITHIMIADRLLEMGLPLDERGLAIGSIAPDCNIENETWTAFQPPREITHFMTGHSKLTADFEGFYARYVDGKSFDSDEAYAYLIGYYAHLLTDAACQRFIRDEQRVKASYDRIRSVIEYSQKVKGHPESFDTLKKVFGKMTLWSDFAAYEQRYILNHPESLYNRILRKTAAYSDPLGILPDGAIGRKIPLMAYEVIGVKKTNMLFFSDKEIEGFIDETTMRIFRKICK